MTSQLNDSLNSLHELFRQCGVYLYPGSGADLAPLLLLPPGGPFGKRPFLRDAPRPDQLLLWMVDPLPIDGLLEDGGSAAYPELWNRFRTRCHIRASRPLDLGPVAPPGSHHVLDVDIVRPAGVVDRTQVVYSSSEIEHFPIFFRNSGLEAEWMAFIKATGSLGGGPPADWLLPKFEQSLEPHQMPEALVGDDHFVREGGVRGYERLGSREPEWTELNAPDYRRMPTGGLIGWGIGYSLGTASLWVRSDRYEHYMQTLRCHLARGRRGARE